MPVHVTSGRRAALIVAGVALLAPFAGAHAQLAPGERVRLTLGRTRVAEGRFIGADSGSLYLVPEPGSATLRIPRDSFSRAELFVGSHRAGSRAIKRGLMAGTVAGVVGGAFAGTHGTRDAGAVAGNLLVGGLIGAVAGGSIGTLQSGAMQEEWRAVEVRPDVVAAAAPGRLESPDVAAPRPSLVPSSARAGRVPGLVSVGDTVRLHLAHQGVVTGILAHVDSATLTLLRTATGDSARYERARVEQAEVRRGDRKRGGAAFGTGTAVGVGVGLGLVGLALATRSPQDEGIGVLLAIVYGFPVSTLTGMGAGAVMSQTYVDRWISFDPRTMEVGAGGR